MKKKIKINNVLFLFKSIKQYDKSRFFISSINLLLSICVGTFLPIYFYKYMIDSIIHAREFTQVLIFLLISLIAYTVQNIFSNWYSKLFIPKSNLKIKYHMQIDLFNKISESDLISYDNPEFYEKYTIANNEADTRLIAFYDSIYNFISNILGVLTVVSILTVLDFYMIIFATIPFILSVTFTFIKNKQIYRFNLSKMKVNRKIDYYKNLFYLKESSNDLKITSVGKTFTQQYEENINNLKDLIKKISWKIGLTDFFLFDMVQKLIFSGTLLYLAFQALIVKAISLGSVSSLYVSIESMTTRLTNIFNILPEIQQHSLYIDNYREFLEYEPHIQKNSNGLLVSDNSSNDIQLKDVWFKYPRQNEFALKNINIHIHKGEKVAFVGHNGAGKTTLIKIIMRLYEPTSGQVFLDGRAVEEYNLSSYYSNFGVVFQNYQLYAISVKDNVDMGREYDESRIWNAIEKSGLEDKIKGLDNTFDTSVTKEFDENGVEFSGGESQKVALARAYATEGGIIILDEPSSALDPIAEEEMHNNILSLAQNKTVILISHRLSTTKYADKIYYFENGEVIEHGSHSELMEANGNYAHMFRLQSKKYAE